jgi:hypothetical protein
MHYRSVRFVLVSALIAAYVCGLPPISSAQETTPPGAAPALDSNQIVAAFASSGYQVDEPHTWSWTQPPFTSVRVRDLATGRVLSVLIYPSAAAAEIARLQAAHAQGQSVISSTGPYLVTGFGPSLWMNNVALVESRESLLERLYQAQVDRDNGVLDVQSAALADERPAVVVDVDFLQALLNGAVNL